jgi:hypothetical protein
MGAVIAALRKLASWLVLGSGLYSLRLQIFEALQVVLLSHRLSLSRILGKIAQLWV